MQHATFSNQILREGETGTKPGGKIRQQPLEVKIMARNLMKPDHETIDKCASDQLKRCLGNNGRDWCSMSYSRWIWSYLRALCTKSDPHFD